MSNLAQARSSKQKIMSCRDLRIPKHLDPLPISGYVSVCNLDLGTNVIMALVRSGTYIDLFRHRGNTFI